VEIEIIIIASLGLPSACLPETSLFPTGVAQWIQVIFINDDGKYFDRFKLFDFV
jgi:hypothetical protein